MKIDIVKSILSNPKSFFLLVVCFVCAYLVFVFVQGAFTFYLVVLGLGFYKKLREVNEKEGREREARIVSSLNSPVSINE